ncbi:acyl-CoA carboxylase subunit epsilon [Catenuloplanes sp. NPDC051500]|uniref:acyl-CoA carboxylase subunit epsilon n=1 Tax=Catenuloplanes sp. NPDC051500 TaxID=3363959 RepID=UPI0037A7C67B
MHSGDRAPDLTILRGTPTAEEIAALVGALRAVARISAPPAAAPESTWARSARPGFTPSWQHSALPR